MSRDNGFESDPGKCQLPGELLTSPIKQAGDSAPMTQGLKLRSSIAGSCSVIMLVTGDFEGPAATVSVMQFQ